MNRPYRGVRYQIWRKLYLWMCRFFPDYHDVTLTNADGEQLHFFCYGDLVASWSDNWEFRCSCEEHD